jgi:hypothetical protein
MTIDVASARARRLALEVCRRRRLDDVTPAGRHGEIRREQRDVAPRRLASSASATPIRPDERLPT